MVRKADRLILVLYLLGFVTLALSVALNQPLADTPPHFGNPPDEHARYLVPQFICETGKLPTGWEEEIRIPSYGFSYALYNAFPYIVQGFAMRLVSTFTQSELLLLYTARMVNVVSGLLMAVVVYLLGRRLFADRRFRWLFCFAVTYLPQGIFIHTYVNTDSFCMLSTSMMVYGLVMGYQEGMNRRSCLWMSGGIILCALSYYNAYGYILSCILLFLAYFISKKNGRIYYAWKQMLGKGIFISVLVLAGIGWWFVRSYIVLDGDILGLETRQKMAELYADESVNPLTVQTFQERGYSVWEMIKEKNTFEGAFYSFVAAYGSMSVFGSIWLYRMYKLFFGLGALGAICWLCDSLYDRWYLRSGRNVTSSSGKKLLRAQPRFFHINMIFCMIMPAVLMLYYAYIMDYQDQGRYLLPGLLPLMYYTVKGLEKLAKVRIGKRRPGKRSVNALVIGWIVLIIIGTLEVIYFRAMPIYW